MRIDPPPSFAWAMGTMPAATAAALPPEEPPGVRDGSHGLRAGPKRRLGDGQDAELRRVGLADYDRPRLPHAAHERAVHRRHPIPHRGSCPGWCARRR